MHDHERHQKCQRLPPERLLRVQRGPSRLRVLGDQFQVTLGGHGGDRERHQERQPGRAADLGRNIPGQRVDTRAQNVANDEQQQ